jgi:UDP-N-acetylglucosamine 4-epimerase
MTPYEQALANLKAAPKRWLVTGAAGFIGSNLAEALLAANQTVVGLDTFATGKPANVKALSSAQGQRFTFIEGDIRSLETCRRACGGADYVLHQAAQVSVPASIQDPVATHETNVTGFLNILLAARDARIRRLIYASSCAVYGDSTRLPLKEDQPARPLSPYAASKLANEVYADMFSRADGLESIGLRYFNVFGPRQDPKGVYAAVIPLWTASMLRDEPIEIFGDGSTTRDFCYIANVVQANLLAATADMNPNRHEVVNVAVGGRTSLNDLFAMLRSLLLADHPHLQARKPVHREFRLGDIRHSQADITKAQQCLGYSPSHTVEQGLREALVWYRKSMTGISG